MEKVKKTNFWKYIWNAILFVLFVITPPLCIAIGVRAIDYIPWFNKLPGSNQDWISFWGGFMGSVVGVVGAIYIFQKQIDAERENTNQQLDAERELTQVQINESRQQIKDERIDNTFFNLINLHIRNKEIIPVLRNKDSYKSNHKTIEEIIAGGGTEHVDYEINLFSTILEEIPEQIKKDTQEKHIFKQKNYILDYLNWNQMSLRQLQFVYLRLFEYT